MSQISVLWVSDTEARFVHLSNDRMERRSIRAASAGGPHPSPSAFFRAIAAELSGSERLLVLGIWQSVLNFKAFLKESLPALCDRVMSWERMDKPVDSEIAASATRLLSGGAADNGENS